MRRMSFAMTMPAIEDRSKTVTRRKGWLHLKVGDRLAAVEKTMGFAKGEKAPDPVCSIEVVDVRREPIRRLLRYPPEERVREGVASYVHSMGDFIERLCLAMNLKPEDDVTRIEFRYVT